MSFFRRKSEKHKASTQASDNSKNAGLNRSSSLRNDRNISQTSPKLWRNNNDKDGTVPQKNGSVSELQRPHSLLLSANALSDMPVIPVESLASPVRSTSRLSKTFQEIIHDKDGLSCFKEFMKMERAENLIQFWCDAESFQAATLMRLRSHALQSVSKSSLLKRRSNSLAKKNMNTEGECVIGLPQDIPCGGTDGMVLHGEGSHMKLSSVETPTIEIIPSDDVKQSHVDSESSHLSAVPKVPFDVNSQLLSNTNSTILSSHPTSLSSSCVNQNMEDKSCANLLTMVEGHLSDKVSEVCDSKPDIKQFEMIPTPNSCEGQSINQGAMHRIHNSTAATGGISSDCEKQENMTAKTSSITEVEDLASKLRKSIERDAVTIFSNYIAKDAPKPLGVDDGLRADTISKICREDGQVDPECFFRCQQFVLTRMETGYFQSFRDSAYHSKHQINVLTSGTVYLPDILLAENALCYFLEHMEQEGASELMQFWLAVNNFQQQLTLSRDDYDSDQAQNDAMVIYDKYFSLQATNPMGFDDKIRFMVEENICREGGPLPDCFTEAKNIILKTLDKMYFSSYLQSQVYYRYLSDLVSTVQMAEDFHHKPKGHHRSGSDASSEHSMSSQSASEIGSAKARNTLLAVDTRKGKKGAAAAAIEGDFSMTMDMFNPDDLWKRTSPGGLSLGSVDGFGQFVSNFEHGQLDKRKGSGFLKRWKEKEKEQEEVALRIAQMIIKDVNIMTQSSDSLGDDEDDDEGNRKRSNQGR